MPTYKANLRTVIEFDVEVEADNEQDAMLCMTMADDPSDGRTLADLITAFDPDLEAVKTRGIIVRYFNEVRFRREVEP
jgi:hypothetical protein